MNLAEISHANEMSAMIVEIERLNQRFPCGHRVIDWDDSYGECVACKLKERADAYDNLPLTVIECHDKIEELQQDIARLKAMAE